MLEELTLTPSTIIIIALIVICVFFAIRRLVRKGLCDCHDGCDGCSKAKKKGESAACSHCNAADAMVANMEKSLNKSDK